MLSLDEKTIIALQQSNILILFPDGVGGGGGAGQHNSCYCGCFVCPSFHDSILPNYSTYWLQTWKLNRCRHVGVQSRRTLTLAPLTARSFVYFFILEFCLDHTLVNVQHYMFNNVWIDPSPGIKPMILGLHM